MRLDLTIPQEPRKMIYQITNDFPVQRPYSSTSDWQRVLEKYSIQQQAFINEKPVDTNYDGLAESILALSNRNWIRDQLKMHMENRIAAQDSLSNLVKQKLALQLREHFTWIVWAVAQYYFGAPERASGQGEEFDNNQFLSRATIPEQDVSAFEDQESQQSYNSRVNTQKPNQQILNNSSKLQPGEIAKPRTIFTCKLPKTNSVKWTEGFSFKGVFFKLLPYEDASYVLEEMKALRAVQTELLDLQAQEQAYLSQQQDYTDRECAQGPGISLQGSFADGRLHKDLILPFLAGVKCCGFYLYGTPLIYTQEVRGEEKKSGGFKDNFIGSISNSIVNLDSEGYISDDILGLAIPRFSSVCPPAGTGFENFDTLNRRGTFNYLHENIDEETLRDPVMQRMPLLKNISRRNLIPVIDFEEFNNNGKDIYASTVSNNSGIPASFQINYLMVYLSSALRSLSTESVASVLFTLPSQASEDIIFYPYPQDKTIELNELEKMLTQNAQAGPGNVSIKPLGDREEVKGQKLLQETGFNRKFMSKHGWHCFLIEKRASDMQQQQFSIRGFNDNKRATTFFSLRENSAGGLESLLTAKESAMSIIIEDNEPNGTPYKVVETPQSNPFRKAGISENLESTPRIKMNLAPGAHNSATRASQHIFISPNKKTVMKRQEVNKDDCIHGNVVVAAVYKGGFKVLSSLSQHSYANGIETMFQLSLEHVAKILDSSDRVSNMDALKDLMHRKGLNLRFLWALLTKVKLKMSRDLIMASILIRTMRKIINEEVKIGSCIKKQTSQIPFMQSSGGLPSGASNFYRRSSNSNSAASAPFQKGKLSAMNGQHTDPDHYQGNRSQLFRECLTLYANAVMKNKFAKYKQVFDETLLGLFFSRLKILTLAHQLDLNQSQMNYLESKDIIDHVLEMPSQNPIMFLNAIQTYFNLDYKKEFTRLYRQDKYFILNKPQPIGRSDITRINQKVHTYFSLREQAYFILARKISHNQRLRANRIKQNQERAERESVSLSKVFQRPSNRGLNTSTQSFDQTQTDRLNNADETPRISGGRNPRMNNLMNNGKSGKQNKFQKSGETHRKFQNLQSQQSISNSSGLYQNIIDLSRTKRNHFRPTRCGEILLPSNLYKLHTNVNDQQPNSVNELFTNNNSSVFQPYYELPNADVLNEWVIVLESLLHEVYSVQGCEAVLLEALTYQCIMTLFLEQDSDSSFKILAKVRDLLHQAFVCPPELVMMSMTLMGVWQDMNEEIEQFPIESEKHYIAALITAFQIYGDPRGRGNYSVPFYLFFAWKLSLLSLADGKKINDSELSEELFDSTLISLFNHKRMYKNCQMELVLAQELAHSNKLNQNPSNGALPTVNNLNSSTLIRNGQLLHFEMTLDQQEITNSYFNMRKYRKRHKNVVTAGGFVKTSYHTPVPLATTANNLGDRVGQTGIKPYQQSLLNGGKQSQFQNDSPAQSISHLQKHNKDAEISDLDIEIKIDDDIDRQRLAALNFKESETVVGKAPFPHWTINRQIIQSQSNMLAGEKPNEAKQMQREMVRDQLTKSVDMEALFPWIVTYNPIMTCSGLRWDAQTIKEVVFGQNSQINGTSEPSSITFSSHKMSQYSYRSNSERGSKTRRAFLNPYSTYIGKEVGGIQKGEILGQLYSWGTDQFGQLGLEYFVTNKTMGSMQSLKVLHPRIVVPLKDELIKEICCGYAHTLAINQFGQMYSWGQNESGQLGIGNENVPDVVRKPVLNTFIKNVAKLAAGHEHSLALTKTQDLYVWGTGSLTGLGLEENIGIPTHFDFFSKAKSEASLSSSTNKITQIACGGLHTAVVTQEGELFTWGSSEGGQLGHEVAGDSDEQSVKRPTRVEFLASRGLKISQVSCGEAHTVVLTSEDQVWGWGMSMYGQLGLGFSGDSFEPGEGMEKSKVTVPTEITQYMPPEITVAKIICGAAFTMFLTTENELYGCGINDLGQLGLDTYLEEMQIAVLDRARQTAGGIRDAITSDVTVPSRVICFEGLKVSSVSCGESHSLALIGEEKSLWAWGMYRNGQLGLGEVNQKMNPRPVQTLHTANVHKLAAGSQHSLALLGDSNQLTEMAANFFLNSDLLTNPWAIDCRRLTTEDSNAIRQEISIAQKPMI